jgi:cell division transport system permease protein
MGAYMKSFRNHLSLVVALLSILFSLQTFIVVDRSISAYKEKLAQNYSLIVVSQKNLKEKEILKKTPLSASLEALSPDSVIKRLNTGIDKQSVAILKLSLPKFYKLKLKTYPSPSEVEDIKKSLLKISSIVKVESFSKTHNTTYKLLLLFKSVIAVLAFSVAIVTILLISKEMKIWQLKHTERMSIMGLFGAPTWLSSAVLFRLAIVDALIATLLAFLIFIYISSSAWISEEFKSIGIDVEVFDILSDTSVMLALSMTLSILLAAFIVLSHKEEV